MSKKDLPDYLDVSSNEEPDKSPHNNTPNKEDISYHSYKSKEKYCTNHETKHHKRNKRHKSRSRNRHRSYIKSRSRSRSRSGSYHHRSKRRHNHKNIDSYYSRSLSNSLSSSYNRERNKYHYKKYKYKRRNSSEHSEEYSKNKTDNKNNKKEYSSINKWIEGEKKQEFKQIKIEKYDKNKHRDINKNNTNEYKSKEKQKEKEISQLKKDLINQKENVDDIGKEKEKPNFNPSGILQKDLELEYNKAMNNKIIINYSPPNDSIIPDENDIWFLFKFAQDKKEAEETYKLINKEFFLIGKDPRICDIRIKQQNISRQHAVIQFRKIRKEKAWEILPYLIDLNITNGTYLNGDKIDNKKYYELRDKDELNFGDKKIDFVLMKMK